jgi:hypothetical protein
MNKINKNKEYIFVEDMWIELNIDEGVCPIHHISLDKNGICKKCIEKNTTLI